MYLMDIFTVPELHGLSMFIPCGISKNNMPIGMQFIGGQYEETIIRAAYTL